MFGTVCLEMHKETDDSSLLSHQLTTQLGKMLFTACYFEVSFVFPLTASNNISHDQHNRFLFVFFLFAQQFGFTEEFFKEIERAGDYVVGDSVEAQGFFVNQKKLDKNYVYLPPLTVTPEYSFISGIASFLPSPDWYSGFYLFETIKEKGQTYWQSFKIRSYPWDSGTDDGTHYEDPDRDTDPPGVVKRIELGDTEDNILLSPEGDELRYMAEWECVLHTCPVEDPDCEKPDWPPANGCDVMRYPECAEVCDPATMQCEQCKRTSSSEPRVFHRDCCMAGRVPKNGRKCDNEESSGAATVSATSAALTAILLGLAVML